MVLPAHRTPPAALHYPALGDCFSFRLQNALSTAPGLSWLRLRDLEGSVLRTYLAIAIVLCGRREPSVVKIREREGGKKGGRKGTLTIFQLHLDPLLGIWDRNESEKLNCP